MARQQQDKIIGFKAIILLKDQNLGIGAYGAVCKAKCDDLLCAAKVIHPTLFDPTALHQVAPQREHRVPFRRFQLECEFLSTIRHPNIVQYLGTHQDSSTGLPVLLMELMDDSLTHFLESSTQAVSYHIQVNICHDITRALSFLHSNEIVHRDLSSNNVLLIGNIRAKLTDFGMVRLSDLNPHATHFTNTMCPGTDVYMPPEAVQDNPVYTEKIDCFSFGVITVQTLTREFPRPGDRQKIFDDPRFPKGTLKQCVPEIERRQNHISQIDPTHPLLPIALDCLKDRDSERPSAHWLCEHVASLKKTPEYKTAHERMKNSSGNDRQYEQIQNLQQNLEEKNRVIIEKDAMIAEREQQLRGSMHELNQQILQKTQQIQQLNQQVLVLERERQQLEWERNQAIQENVERERQLRRVKQHLEESEQLIAEICQRNTELEEQLRNYAQEQDRVNSRAVNRPSIRLKWREGEKAPCNMGRYCHAIVDNTTLYCKCDRSNQLYAYNIPSSTWSPIPECSYNAGGFVITVIDGLLTTVGGYYGYDFQDTNKLFSLIGEGSNWKWTEMFPPMPTKRYHVAVLCSGTALVVAGGACGNDQKLKKVEILSTESRQWYTAPDLPEPLSELSLVLNGDQVYLLGGINKDHSGTNSVYTSSLSTLLLSTVSKSQGGHFVRAPAQSNKGSMWNRVIDLPVTLSTGIYFRGQLLTFGGKDSDEKPTTAVYMYKPMTNSWAIISHMTTPRCKCIAAVLPNNQLMVLGGSTTDDKKWCDSVEFGTEV